MGAKGGRGRGRLSVIRAPPKHRRESAEHCERHVSAARARARAKNAVCARVNAFICAPRAPCRLWGKREGGGAVEKKRVHACRVLAPAPVPAVHTQPGWAQNAVEKKRVTDIQTNLGARPRGGGAGRQRCPGDEMQTPAKPEKTKP